MYWNSILGRYCSYRVTLLTCYSIYIYEINNPLCLMGHQYLILNNKTLQVLTFDLIKNTSFYFCYEFLEYLYILKINSKWFYDTITPVERAAFKVCTEINYLGIKKIHWRNGFLIFNLTASKFSNSGNSLTIENFREIPRFMKVN